MCGGCGGSRSCRPLRKTWPQVRARSSSVRAPGQQGHDDVRVHRRGRRPLQHCLGLSEGERLGRTARLPLRHRAQLDDVALHLVPRHGPLDGAVQARVKRLEGAGAEGLGLDGEPAVHILRAEVAELTGAKRWNDVLLTQERHCLDRAGVEARQAIRQPVRHHALDRVVGRRDGEAVLVVPQHLLELLLRLGLGLGLANSPARRSASRSGRTRGWPWRSSAVSSRPGADRRHRGCDAWPSGGTLHLFRDEAAQGGSRNAPTPADGDRGRPPRADQAADGGPAEPKRCHHLGDSEQFVSTHGRSTDPVTVNGLTPRDP